MFICAGWPVCLSVCGGQKTGSSSYLGFFLKQCLILPGVIIRIKLQSHPDKSTYKHPPHIHTFIRSLPHSYKFTHSHSVFGLRRKTYSCRNFIEIQNEKKQHKITKKETKCGKKRPRSSSIFLLASFLFICTYVHIYTQKKKHT